MRKSAKRSRKGRPENAPSVGIFFAVGPKLWIDMTPLSGAGTYGEFKIHERGHDEYWELLIRQSAVAPDSEYEEHPRGRVAYNERTQQFSLLADNCILRQKDKVTEIIQTMHLPAARTRISTDPHYRCADCLTKRDTSRKCSTVPHR
jgi:hypothetical protein